MSIMIVVAALALLMFVAYRGFSVILFAPICALLAVFDSAPSVHNQEHGEEDGSADQDAR
jgi:H+/gluconate symporter-like permease